MFFETVWTTCVFGAIPFAFAVLFESWRQPPRFVAAGGFSWLVAVASARAWLAPSGWFEARPWLMLGLILVGVAISMTVLVIGRLDLASWGVASGELSWWLPRFLVLMALIIPLVAVAVGASPELRAYYPEYKPARESGALLARYQLANGLYMLSWEYFFRGFLTFGVAARAGAGAALLVSTLPFVLLHAGKPEVEMAASFVLSIFVGAFCLRAKTFLPAVFLHWVLNLTLDLAGFFF